MTTSETSTDQKLKQTSLQEAFRANHSQLPVSEEDKMMTVISGTKLLELLPKQNQDGLLGKMLTALLTSPTVQSCSRYKKIWKQRISKSNVSLFQLAVSVRGTKEKEFGLLVTPTATQMPKRSKEAMEKRIAFRKSIGRKTVPFSSLEEQITTMFPTPTASNAMDVVNPPENVSQNSKGWTVKRKGTGTKFGAKLNDVVNKLYRTPTTSDTKDMSYNPITCKKPKNQIKLPHQVLENNRLGGKLNPNFVEFLMAYPTDWTKIEPTELNHSETQ